MKGLLEKIDLFPYRINFNYKKNNVFHSFFGIGLSIMMYGVLIFFINYFSRDFLYNTNPQIIYKESIFTEKLVLKFDDIFQNIRFNLKNFSNYEKMLNKKNKSLKNKTILDLSYVNFFPDGYEKTKLSFNFIFSPDSNESIFFEKDDNTIFNIEKRSCMSYFVYIHYISFSPPFQGGVSFSIV